MWTGTRLDQLDFRSISLLIALSHHSGSSTSRFSESNTSQAINVRIARQPTNRVVLELLRLLCSVDENAWG